MLKSEAIEFLKNVLKLENVESKSSDLEFLKDICRRMPQVLPFQNLTMLLNVPENRHLPTLEEVMKAGSSGVGGVCYTFGNFGQQLLQALGYEVFKVSCTVLRTGKQYTHVACIVKGFAPGERYFVDFGASYPTFEPIPLHALPQHYEHAFLKYTFVRKDDGKIERRHMVSSTQFLDGVSALTAHKDDYQTFYEFEEIPRENDFLVPYQTPIYTIPGYAAEWLLMGLRMTVYPEDAAFTINDFVLRTWRKGEKVDIFPLKDEKELEDAIKKYFPTLAGVNVSKAVANWAEAKKLFSKTKNN